MSQPLCLDVILREKLNDIEAHVHRQLRGRITQFRVAMQGTGLVLKGSTPTYYAKQLAQHAVMAVAADLPIRANEIEVLAPVTSTLTSA
jgi:hypothetical protein